MSKCFDRVTVELAVQCLRRFGLPEEICSLITRFYGGLETWFTMDGAIARMPVHRMNGIMQGCPFNAMLLAAIMTVFARHLHEQVPGVNWGIFLDDRIA